MELDFKYDVFLSYSSRDADVVRKIAERLKSDGVRVWFDEWEIRPGDSIPAKIDDGLENSRALVLCMSAQALAADWPQLESHTFRFKDPLNHERRFIPLRLDDVPSKGSLAQFRYIDWRPEQRAREYANLLAICRGEASDIPQREATHESPHTSAQESGQAGALTESEATTNSLRSNASRENENGVIIADEERASIWSAIVGDVVGEGRFDVRAPRDFDSDRAAIALLDEVPSFVILPLTLPGFGALRIAEFTHRRASETRVLLVSGTNCEVNILKRLFDSVIRPGGFSIASLTTALNQPVHRIRDETDLESAIVAILENASCFLIYAREHIFPHHPSIHDYRENPSSVITVGNYFQVVSEIRLLRTTLEATSTVDPALIDALRAIENGTKSQLRTTEGMCVSINATPDRIRGTAQKALRIAKDSRLEIALDALKNWLGGGEHGRSSASDEQVSFAREDRMQPAAPVGSTEEEPYPSLTTGGQLSPFRRPAARNEIERIIGIAHAEKHPFRHSGAGQGCFAGMCEQVDQLTEIEFVEFLLPRIDELLKRQVDCVPCYAKLCIFAELYCQRKNSDRARKYRQLLDACLERSISSRDYRAEVQEVLLQHGISAESRGGDCEPTVCK